MQEAFVQAFPKKQVSEVIVLSAGVIVARQGPSQWDFLLLRAYRYWDFPKGIVESGEEPLDAAIREVKEEADLEGLEFTWGGGYYETPPYGKDKIARYYLAQWTEGEVRLQRSPELGRPEHHEFRWVSHRQGMELLGDRVGAALGWANKKIGGAPNPHD